MNDEQSPDQWSQMKTKTFSFSAGPNLEDIRQLHSRFSTARNWDQFHTPRNIFLALVGEVGELAELFQWRGDKPDKWLDWEEREKQSLGQELSDVLIYLIRLADRCGVDLEKLIGQKAKTDRNECQVIKAIKSSGDNRINKTVENTINYQRSATSQQTDQKQDTDATQTQTSSVVFCQTKDAVLKTSDCFEEISQEDAKHLDDSGLTSVRFDEFFYQKVDQPIEKTKFEENKLPDREHSAVDIITIKNWSFSFSQNASFENIRQLYSCSSDQDVINPRNVLLSLIRQVGATSELFERYQDAQLGLKNWNDCERKAVEKKLINILIDLIKLSDICQVDLPKAVVDKLKANEIKYPVDKVFGCSKKYTEYKLINK